MTAIIFIVTALMTFYTGGICRSIPLMTLSAAEGIILALMLILCIFMLRNISGGFTESIIYGYKNAPVRVPVNIIDSIFIPQHRVSFYCVYFYKGSKKGKRIKIISSLNGCSHSKENAVIRGDSCGIIHIQGKKIATEDILGIFKLSKKWVSSADILILPRTKPLFIKRKSPAFYNDSGENTGREKGDMQEIYQIREYRTGDSFKNIHRNISARTDELYIKEYRSSARDILDLIIDIDRTDIADRENADAFYELCSAVILGIFENMGNLNIWLTDGSAPMFMDSKENIPHILARIYYFDSNDVRSVNARGGFMLNSRLELYFEKKSIYRFSSKNIEKELETVRLDI